MVSIPPSEFTNKAERVSSLVSAARRLLDEGQVVELSALTGHVEELCRYINDNPTEDSGSHKESLKTIMENLDELENKMAEKHKEFTRQFELSTRARAMKAYGKTDEETP